MSNNFITLYVESDNSDFSDEEKKDNEIDSDEDYDENSNASIWRKNICHNIDAEKELLKLEEIGRLGEYEKFEKKINTCSHVNLYRSYLIHTLEFEISEIGSWVSENDGINLWEDRTDQIIKCIKILEN
jgi:hypothetical protein